MRAEPRTLYLIDGHSQIFRAYYAPFGNLTAPSGEPTRATHVFCQMLLNILRDKKPDYLAVVMDVSDETVFRKDIYPEYKSHRQPTPEDLPVQIDRIVSILQTAGVPILRKERFEADDIMATLARRLPNHDLRIFLVSRDKDLEQLLSDRVSLFDPMKDEVITSQRLLELRGWTPQQAIDAQALIGDSVDNVPGVEGVGPKSAAKLLQKYGSAEAVVAHADELTPRQRESVRKFAPKLELTRKLVTLRDDVPIEYDVRDFDVRRFNWAAVRPVFEELGFRRLLDQLPDKGGAGVPPEKGGAGVPPEKGGTGVPPEKGGAGVPPAKSTNRRSDEGTQNRRSPRQKPGRTSPPAPSRDEAVLQSSALRSRDGTVVQSSALPPATTAVQGSALPALAPPRGEYRLILQPDEFERFVGELSVQPAFALDTETTDVNPIDADLVGLSFAWGVGRGYYLPVRSAFGDPLPLNVVRERLTPILADPGKLKIGHNLKYDLLVLRQAGLPVAGPLFDTMIAAFVLDPLHTSFGLDRLVERAFGHRMTPISDLIGKGRDQLRMDQVPLAHIAEYAGEDADYTWRLKLLFESQLAASDVAPLFYDTEMPLVDVLTEMEFNGVSLDAAVLEEMSRDMAARVEAIAEEAYALAGMRFNIDSPKQLAELLFDKLGFRVVRRTRTARSTDADTLEVLARETAHPLLRLLLEYREIQKLRGTYVDALPKARSRRTDRIHTSYRQIGAITGRLSSSEPNLQNIPIRTELGRQIRRAFVPRTRDEVLIVADYSQVELRILAHFSQDEALIRAFAADRDIHAFVAAQVNGVPLSDVTPEMRSRAKAVNFGIIYGQTPHGLSQASGMSRTEAQDFIANYFRRYPRVRAFLDQIIANARRDGFVRTILGRRRPVPDLDSRNRSARAQAERIAVNTVMQGSAADLIKVAMIRLHRRIREEKLPLRMLLQVHDELVCEGPRNRAAELGDLIADVMSHALELRVPLKVDVGLGENWLAAK